MSNVLYLYRLTEALLAANDHLLIPGRDGYDPDNYSIIKLYIRSSVRMSDAVDDMVAYTNLNDSVIHMIMSSVDPNLQRVSDEYSLANDWCITRLKSYCVEWRRGNFINV